MATIFSNNKKSTTPPGGFFAAPPWVISAGARAHFTGGFYDGNKLYAACSKALDAQTASDVSLCAGYVAAVADVMGEGITINGYKSCLPAGPNFLLRQVKDVVTRFLAAHPELRHYSAPDLVANAIAQAFPCR